MADDPILSPTGVPTQQVPQKDISNVLRADSSSGSYADMTASLLRSQFANWEQQFKPIELQAIDMLSWNPHGQVYLQQGLQDAAHSAVNSSDAMGGILDRSNAAMGIQPTTQQAATSKRLLDLTKASNIAGAENTTRANTRLQDELLLLGASPNPNIVKSSTSG